MQPTPQNHNVTFTWGLADLRRMEQDAANVWIPITDATLTGWAMDYHSEYRENSAILQTGNGSIQITAPRDGRFYPGFILYDEAPGAALAIFVNGRQQGTAVANDGDNNQKLFALTQPVELKKGGVVELRNLNNAGPYRVEGLLLLKDLFPAKANQYTFNYVAATRPWQQDDAMRITFTSSWPVQAAVHYGVTEKMEEEVREKPIPLNNHRVYLRGLKEGQKYFYQLSGIDRDGQKVLSPLHSFVYQKPGYPAAVAQTHTVPLQLSSVPAGMAWPVSSGVPLAPGDVFEPQNLRLLNASGQPVGAQKKVLARWHDGSIKWVLLSFLAAPAQTAYQLQYGEKIHDANVPSIALQEPDGSLTVNTGALQWSAHQGSEGAYAVALAQNGKVLLGDAQIVITDQDGKSYTSSFKPDQAVIEENGPHHAVVLMRGTLANAAGNSRFFRYEARWYFTGNSPLARVKVTLINDQVQRILSEVQSAALRFQLPSTGNASGTATGNAAGTVTLAEVGTYPARADAPVGVLQTYDDQYQAQTPDGVKSGARFPGWLQWQGGQDGPKLSLAVRNFWQLYPKALQVQGNTLEVGLAPPVTAADYARFKGTVEEHRSVFYLMDGKYKLRAGVSFTTEIALDAGALSGHALNDYVNHQPVLMPTPEYYRDVKAFGDIGLGNQFPLVQNYNAKTARSFSNYLKDRDRMHEYGLMNFGDWWGERGINWGNVEYDTQHAFILEFARSGDISYLRAAEDAEIHNRDIDTVHADTAPPEKYFNIGGGGYSAAAATTGRVWEHSVGHTGGYFAKSPVDGQGFAESIFSSSHTWTEGHYEYYCMTGDTRSLDTANNIADVYDAYALTNYDFSNCRVPGWLLIFTMGAYNATNDPFYLNAARIVVDRVLERQTPDGGWGRQLVPGHCGHMPRHHGNAGFMVGTLMSGLKYYAEATGDQRAKDSIVKAAHFMINDMWIPQAAAFRYTSCPNTPAAPSVNLLICEGIAYAWRQTRDPQLRRVTLDAMETMVAGMDGIGKNISMELRSTPRQLFDVTEMLKISGE